MFLELGFTIGEAIPSQTCMFSAKYCLTAGTVVRYASSIVPMPPITTVSILWESPASKAVLSNTWRALPCVNRSSLNLAVN